MKQKQTKKVEFKDANNILFDLEISLTIDKQDGTQKFSISGHGNGGGGQVVDDIKPTNNPQEELVELWKKYHLNDMHAGTEKQEEKLNEKDNMGDYTKQCEYLKSFDHDGNPIPAYKSKEIEQQQNRLKKEIDDIKEELKTLEYHKEEQKQKARFGGVWVIIKELGIKEFATTQFKYQGIFNKEERKRNEKLKRLEKELEDVNKQTLLYDYLEDGTLYRYGTSWLKRELPNDIWDKVENIVSRIEHLENENTKAGGKWEDIVDFKIVALGKYLNIETKEAEHNIKEIDEGMYDYCGRIFWVLTEDEAYDKCVEYLGDEMWQMAVEGGRTTMGKDEWIDYVIEHDGFGSILNHYDGTEYFDDDNNVYIIRER